MRPFGGSLSSILPPDAVAGQPTPVHFDIIVIGSGYGASIMAARLAEKMRPGVRLALMERGAEWRPGDFPESIGSASKEARLKPLGRDRRSVINPIGLYDIVQTNELRILAGSGLGGCSLINANVALRPDIDVFSQPQWPLALQDRNVLEPYYERAAWELGVQTETPDRSFKMRAQRLAAQRLSDIGCHFEAASLTVTRGPNGYDLPVINRQGLLQRSCMDCGNCMTGCNVGAKNTLATNYLPLARKYGAKLFSQCEVRRVRRCTHGYEIDYLHHQRGPAGDIISTPRVVSASIVILGAGSLGSTEILLRSQAENLRFSPSLGCHWTGNGDALGFVDNSNLAPYSQGVGIDSNRRGPGPTIQSNLTYPLRPLHDRVLIQDGAIACMYTSILKALFLDVNLDSTLPLLAMGHDGQKGRIVLHPDGNADVVWPEILESDYRKKVEYEFSLIAHGHGGKYRRLHAPKDRMITVHPLGGCSMSDNPQEGVVDHLGRVFDFSTGGFNENGRPQTHSGLYVCDGSIFPTAIAANPFFTIAAMTERNAELLVKNPAHSQYFAA